MKSDQPKRLSEKVFRRLTGVKRSTFYLMVEKVRIADAKRKAQGGRANKLSIEDRVLMALEYLRKYRTYLHISQSYEISESVCYKNLFEIFSYMRNPVKKLTARRGKCRLVIPNKLPATTQIAF